MEKEKTERGFDRLSFTDRYGDLCSLQKSSLATEDTIWLGIDKAKPIIMATDAKKLGLPTNKSSGWVDFVVPEEVLISTRMHLTREMVGELLPILQKFYDTGGLY